MFKEREIILVWNISREITSTGGLQSPFVIWLTVLVVSCHTTWCHNLPLHAQRAHAKSWQFLLPWLLMIQMWTKTKKWKKSMQIYLEVKKNQVLYMLVWFSLSIWFKHVYCNVITLFFGCPKYSDPINLILSVLIFSYISLKSKSLSMQLKMC